MNPLSIILLLSLTSLSAVSGNIIVPHKAQVLIYNDLTPRTDLIVHCKSKNDDLGVQHIAYGNYYEFDFRPSVLRNTLFHCTFQWNGTTNRFDIYVQVRDQLFCDHCVWKVRPDGPCLLVNPTICYSWAPPA
ncbi:hypothetical protein like AT1G04645 [Hibiscus trionum]|uniref:S-protein homolog n=1 Tax=Hibiscus trionum TaxID=183268 RepID=A0A9W7LMR4_HIBTR|nr:hypothetical protein like AT1G04645 [Hibiscus trionum]